MRIRLGLPAAAVLLVLAVLHAASPAAGQDPEKNQDPHPRLDEGLTADGRHPVFVAFSDQLLGRAGALEEFAADHDDDPRSEVRAEAVADLKARADASWQTVEEAVQELVADGGFAGLTRFWIVNGFAGTADADTCRALADLPGVDFVYRQRGPRAAWQHRKGPGIPQAQVERRRTTYEGVLAQWRDDRDDEFDPDAVEVPWNVERLRVPEVWKQGITGKGTLCAVMDSGIFVAPGLIPTLWRNPDEELNGKDDDGNGYADDIFGWDFRNGSWYALGDGAIPHGSMCTGIIGARPNNKLNLANGIAPRTQVMSIRDNGHFKALEYAVEMNVDVVNMSFMWINMELGDYRGLIRMAFEHATACGTVFVGGSGNFARNPRGRQIAIPKDIPAVICVSGIVKNGNRAPQSSAGPVFWNVRNFRDHPADDPLYKPDVTACFGGYPVWGRPPGTPGVPRQWKTVSDEGGGFALITGPQGNSFSGPHATGVVALMLEANPDLSPWHVRRILEETADDLGEEGRDFIFGAGLIRADRAVAAAGARGF